MRKWRRPFEFLQTRAVASSLRAIGLTLALVFLALTATAAQVTPTPEPHSNSGSSPLQPYQGTFSDLINEIDAFWGSTFQQAGVPYAPPNIFVVEQETVTGCGLVRPGPNAFYCGLDRTIYLVPQFLVEQQQQFGEYAPIAILSHEWGHHIQTLLGIEGPTRKDFELQADCLMGAFTRHADEQALLDYGEFLQVLDAAIEAGDEVFLPEDFPGAHGMAEDRVKALTKGYGGGPIAGCSLQMGVGASSSSEEPIGSDRQPGSESVQVSLSPALLTLPPTLPLDHASCFRIEKDTALTFEDLLANFGGTNEASNNLQSWGWQASVNRVFACDTPPEGEAGWIDMSLHLFGDAASAQQAVDYFAAVRAEGSTLMSAAPPAIGDHAAVLSGPVANGKESTLYVSRGPLLIRVTGVSPSGIPFTNVLTVAQSILAQPLPPAQPQSETMPTQGVEAYLPHSLPLSHASCFQVDGDGSLDFSELVERFPGVPDAASRLQALGWHVGAYRQFGCDGPPSGHAGWIDASVHEFQDAASAAAAVPFFANSQSLGSELESAPAPNIGDSTTALTGPASNGTEYTLYMSSGPLLFRVTGVAPAGDPAPDVAHVMMGLLAGSIVVGQSDAPTAEAPALPTAIPTATYMPTATAIPTATLAPTATLVPLPTPTPLPQPTATTAPTPTAAPQPTATPRVVLIPVEMEPTVFPTSTVPSPSASCKIVELYPGYPGFRGYVAGIDGPGEVACLDDLIEADPRFDQAAEDAANLAAARAIGLSGSPKDWTWENWMAVEAERGLPATCYSCLFRGLDPPPARESGAWNPSDPRLQMGGYGTSEALLSAASRTGMDPTSVAFIEDMFDPDGRDALGADHVLRAVIGLQLPGHRAAPEMLDVYDQLLTGFAEPGTQFIDPASLWDNMLSQGGYAPTPATAHIQDQLYMVRTSAEAICAGMPRDTCTAWLDYYDQLETKFLTEIYTSGPEISYAEWLRDEVGNPL